MRKKCRIRFSFRTHRKETETPIPPPRWTSAPDAQACTFYLASGGCTFPRQGCCGTSPPGAHTSAQMRNHPSAPHDHRRGVGPSAPPPDVTNDGEGTAGGAGGLEDPRIERALVELPHVVEEASSRGHRRLRGTGRGRGAWGWRMNEHRADRLRHHSGTDCRTAACEALPDASRLRHQDFGPCPHDRQARHSPQPARSVEAPAEGPGVGGAQLAGVLGQASREGVVCLGPRRGEGRLLHRGRDGEAGDRPPRARVGD